MSERLTAQEVYTGAEDDFLAFVARHRGVSQERLRDLGYRARWVGCCEWYDFGHWELILEGNRDRRDGKR